jgi:hypothetical protein
MLLEVANQRHLLGVHGICLDEDSMRARFCSVIHGQAITGTNPGSAAYFYAPPTGNLP